MFDGQQVNAPTTQGSGAIRFHHRRWVAVLAALGMALGSCGGDDDGDTDDTPASEGEESAGEDRFVGLDLDAAIELAESEGRLWRISRDDDEFFAIDASLVDGRVTFEVDDGEVTSADIESEDGPTATAPDGEADDPVLGRLQADAIIELVTVDNSFGSDAFPFDTVIVSSLVDGDTDRPLESIALEFVAAGLEADAAVTFTSDHDAEIADLAASGTAGAAVVEITDIRIDGSQAEIDVGLWCGDVCGVYLTYAAELDGDSWTITGIEGPVAVS